MSSAKERRKRLIRTMRRQPGQYRTGEVMRLYRENGWGPSRATARADLQYLARQGVLAEHGFSNCRFYTLNTRKDGRP
ncbi:hypothetical protein [Streptomyces naphthomycinicus]|uniref:hypothetical protein n=1 Tax=Streptomyces naphthomycinicus TaxID=2872625 RepID=UPI001CEDF8C8|nr:hypothetical protein [Streptomyces sp. TML10]